MTRWTKTPSIDYLGTDLRMRQLAKDRYFTHNSMLNFCNSIGKLSRQPNKLYY